MKVLKILKSRLKEKEKDQMKRLDRSILKHSRDFYEGVIEGIRYAIESVDEVEKIGLSQEEVDEFLRERHLVIITEEFLKGLNFDELGRSDR